MVAFGYNHGGLVPEMSDAALTTSVPFDLPNGIMPVLQIGKIFSTDSARAIHWTFHAGRAVAAPGQNPRPGFHSRPDYFDISPSAE
jgi:hypothetical protein